jgi:hypothetical protein
MIAEEDKPRLGGSVPGHCKSKPRERMEGAIACSMPTTSSMILCTVIEYFKLKRDVVGFLGFATIQKCTVALRMLAYGSLEIHRMTTCACPSTPPLIACTSSAKQLSQCLEILSTHIKCRRYVSDLGTECK